MPMRIAIGIVIAMENEPHGDSARARTTTRASTASRMTIIDRTARSAAAPPTGPISSRAICPSDLPARLKEKKSVVMSCTAPASMTPTMIQIVPGRNPIWAARTGPTSGPAPAMAANRSHPAFTVSPRARASIPQHTAPTMATMTQIPYRPRRLPMNPSYLFPKALLTLSHASTTQKRIEHAPALRAEREQPRGGEAHQDDDHRADDRRVEEDLEGRGLCGQAEDLFEGVVRVGEGDEVPHDR